MNYAYDHSKEPDLFGKSELNFEHYIWYLLNILYYHL